jgi:hypothetical protein
MKWLGNECAEQEVTGSRASGLEALVFRVKNGATCDFDGAGGWLSGGVSPEIKFFFLFFSLFFGFPGKPHHCWFTTGGSKSGSGEGF